MSTRLAKQLIYGTFYVLIWVFIIWFVYHLFVRPAPPPPPVIVTQPIAVLGVNAFAATAGHDTFLGKIANQNLDSAAQSFSYAFNVYDSSGTLLQSYPAQSFLYAREVKYLLLVNQQIPSDVATWNLTVSSATTYWVSSSTFGPVPQLAIVGLSTQIGSSTAGIAGMAKAVIASGQVTNNDTAVFSNVFIIAIFKDSSGNPIGASQTELNTIAPTETQNFSVSYPAIPGVNPALTEVEVYAYRP